VYFRPQNCREHAYTWRGEPLVERVGEMQASGMVPTSVHMRRAVPSSRVKMCSCLGSWARQKYLFVRHSTADGRGQDARAPGTGPTVPALCTLSASQSLLLCSDLSSLYALVHDLAPRIERCRFSSLPLSIPRSCPRVCTAHASETFAREHILTARALLPVARI
jgi:hypothetical protein